MRAMNFLIIGYPLSLVGAVLAPEGATSTVPQLKTNAEVRGERPAASSTGDRMPGETLYNASCIVCHGAGGEGGVGPRLAGNPGLKNDQQFRKILAEGRHMMPPLRDTLTEQQIRDIRTWLETLP